VNIGHYEDTFRKIDSTWLLSRRVTILPFAGSTERLPEAQHPAPSPDGEKYPGAPES